MATEKIKKELYNGEVEVFFFPKSHRYKLDKKRIPSVTGILWVIDKPWLVPRAVNCMKEYLLQLDYITKDDIFEASKQYTQKKKDAADTWIIIHDWIHEYITNQNPEIPEEFECKNWILWFLDWKEEHNVEFIESEKLVYSKKYNYVWHVDAICKIDWDVYLVDFKSSKSVYPAYHLQNAWYWIWIEEELWLDVKWTWILHFNKETWEFNFITRDEKQYKEDKEWFINCLWLFTYIKKNK